MSKKYQVMRIYAHKIIIDINSSKKITTLIVYNRKKERELEEAGRFTVKGNMNEAIFLATNILINNKEFKAEMRI
ncbi:MAG: hypothetical protein ACK5U7_09430 [Bacteroidota bacterium]